MLGAETTQYFEDEEHDDIMGSNRLVAYADSGLRMGDIKDRAAAPDNTMVIISSDEDKQFDSDGSAYSNPQNSSEGGVGLAVGKNDDWVTDSRKRQGHSRRKRTPFSDRKRPTSRKMGQKPRGALSEISSNAKDCNQTEVVDLTSPAAEKSQLSSDGDESDAEVRSNLACGDDLACGNEKMQCYEMPLLDRLRLRMQNSSATHDINS